MINILYLHNSSLISGGERSLLQLWAHLDRKAFTPHLALPAEGPLAVEARHLGVKVYILKVPSLRPWNIFGLMDAAAFLTCLVRQKKIGVIHSYTPRNNLMAVWVSRQTDVPVIWHERNIPWHHEIDITRLFLCLADAVICNSGAVARRFSRKAACLNKVRVIMNGVDTDHFSSSGNGVSAKRYFGWEGKKVVGLVSNLEPRKGVDVFLQVAAIVCRARKDVVFVIVGGAYHGADRQKELQNKASVLGLGGRIVWAGFQDDVRPYLAAFDVSCNVTEKEACSRAILESMAMGVPVVAFRDGGNPELVVDGDTGLLVPSGDRAAFASRIAVLLEDESARIKMGQSARRRVETVFDIRKNTDETQALYRSLIC